MKLPGKLRVKRSTTIWYHIFMFCHYLAFVAALTYSVIALAAEAHPIGAGEAWRFSQWEFYGIGLHWRIISLFASGILFFLLAMMTITIKDSKLRKQWNDK